MAISTSKTEGIHCDGCANREKALLEKERAAEVSNAREARSKYNEHTVALNRLSKAVEQADYIARSST